MKIANKIILDYFIAGYISIDLTHKTLQKSVITEYSSLLIDILNQIDKKINDIIIALKDYSNNKNLIDTLKKSNSQFENHKTKSNTFPPNKDLDFNIKNADLSEFFKEKIKNFNSKYGNQTIKELFIINKYGIIIFHSLKIKNKMRKNSIWREQLQNKKIFIDELNDNNFDHYFILVGIKITD